MAERNCENSECISKLVIGENELAKVLAKANVAYLDDFLAALADFDRKPYGEINFAAAIDEDAHNQVYVTFNWTNLLDARAFWSSETGLAHIATWQSLSAPEFVYLRTTPYELP